MALPGMRSTDDMGTDGRPKNWREGLLLLQPRNKAPLYALTSAMRSRETDDPEFNWWEETLDMQTLTVNGAVASTSEETVTVDANFTRHKAGDLFYNQNTDEVLRVLSITSDTVAELARGAANTTAVNIGDNDVLVFMGSAYREGAPRGTGTSYNPSKVYNYTQIFREPIEWTRTAMKTRLRYTTDIMKEDRRRASHKHSVGIERAFWLGQRYETTESNQPLRYTGGVLSFIDAANKVTLSDGSVDADELFSYFPSIFAYGNSEKLAFCSLNVLQIIGEIVRKNAQYDWGPAEKEYGMNVRRVFSPAGTLVLKEHPLMNQSSGFLPDSLVVLDTENFVYRYITDTMLRKDIEDRGTDGKAEEYLTECGLEVHHPKTHYWIKGITGAAADAI